MCGIAGIWGRSEREAVYSMMKNIAHRGPDAEGMHIRENSGALGHRRLSIMDPKGGDQPIYNESKNSAVIANGEIYNFRKLRKSIEERHKFTTTNDSEVALHLFEESGAESVKKLDGMFAYAIADEGKLFLARDPIGIKPLYFGALKEKGGGSLIFASELKAFSGLQVEVSEFPPGTFYHTDTGFKTYYAVPELQPGDMPFDERVKVLRSVLEEAVGKRLMSDVPLGAFLSGGLDSSIIAAIARNQMDELHTFSVGIEGSRDLEAARKVAKHIDSKHHEYIYTAAEVMEKLPQIIYYLESFDKDLVRSGIPCFFCSRLASEYVKVILTGEGADELFAGYEYYKGISDMAGLHRELRRSVTALHNVNLQRVDRMTMAHGIEGRVPFLDIEMIENALTIPPELKLRRDESGEAVEKWILRKACEDLLPHEIVWRKKEQFDEGSGTVDLLEKLLSEKLANFNHGEYISNFATDRIRNAEEGFYHKILSELYSSSRTVLDNVGRWVDNRIYTAQ